MTSGFSGKSIACPKCREEGRDSTGNHLSLFNDGLAGWCTRGGHGLVRLDGGEEVAWTKQEKRDPAQTIALIKTYPCREYKARKISLETMKHFDVRTEAKQEDGSAYAHWYTYYHDGLVSAVKGRILPKDFSPGVAGKIKSFFGEHLCSGNNFIIVLEGEQDVLAAYEMMLSLKGRAYNVVGLPNGSSENGTIDPVTRSRLEWLSTFNKVVLCLDQDDPGRNTANTIADYLCSKCDVRITQLPLKDTAAMWEAGRADDWMKCIGSSRRYISDQIVLGDSTPLEELQQPLKSGIEFSFIPKTSKKMHGFRTREMTTLIAPPKCGKSSLLRQMAYTILRDTNEQVAGFFFEEQIVKTKQSIIAYHCGMALNRYRAFPHLADKHKVQEAYDTLLPRLHLFTHRNKTITDDLLERKIDYMVKALGCQTAIIDHSTFVTGTRDTNNERRDIDMMLTRLARSVEDEDYRLFIVAHISRKGRLQSREVQKVKYPYWEILSMDDARGSGAYEQLSHNMLGIERERLDPELDNTRGLLRLRILLNREWGVEGLGDYLSFGEDGTFTPVQPEYE